VEIKIRRSLDLTIISGVLKGCFFSKGRPFSLYLYHTQIKHLVLEYKIVGISLKDLKIDVKIGDCIGIFRRWAESRGYKIEEVYR